ncbi:TlpA disulfide reductase family protein [Thermodesulfobacteriota bacterium]
MRRTLLIFALILTTTVSLSLGQPATTQAADLASSANIYTYENPIKLSDLALTAVDGRRVTLSQFKGKVVLLHFWSIKCPACRFEEPFLDALHKAYGKSGLVILGVNLVDGPVEVTNFASKNSCPFLPLHGSATGLRLKVVQMGSMRTSFVINPSKEAVLEVPGLPTTYVLDCRGEAVAHSVGPARWNTSIAQAFIQGLIGDRAKCSRAAPTKRQAHSRLW